MDKIVDEREAVSGRELLRLVVYIGVPGQKGDFVERIRRRFESNAFVPMRNSYMSASKLGGKNDGYGGERSRWCLGTRMIPSGEIGRRKFSLLYG